MLKEVSMGVFWEMDATFGKQRLYG